MIAVFSGTGNSLRVARLLQKELGDAIVMLPGEIPYPADGRLIWVFPIYSWGLPPVVLDAIASSPEGRDTQTFMVATCGDDIGRADRRWAKAVRKRGWCPAGAFSVQMPNTYVLMKGFDVDSPELAQAKVTAAPARVAAIAAAIRQATESGRPASTDVVSGSFAAIKTGVIYPWFRRYAMSPEPFFADDRCIGCGLCARSCPLHNITMTQTGRPDWGDRCTLCLRCYHVCPAHAVCYTTATRGKGQSRLLIADLLSELDSQTH
ncbi:MAG: EFR1 family ferrodoxin [Muribaculaceae bacterium]|nr:EFR1 family ferrodoxin [Muribaculaceae bacterium]